MKKVETGKITNLAYEIINHCLKGVGSKVKKAGYSKRTTGYSFKFKVLPGGGYVYVNFNNKQKQLIIKAGNSKDSFVQLSSGSAVINSPFVKSGECLERLEKLYELYFGEKTKALEQFKPKPQTEEIQEMLIESRSPGYVNILQEEGDYVRLWRVKKSANLSILEELLKSEIKQTKLPNQKVIFDLYVQGEPSYLRMVITAPDYFEKSQIGLSFLNKGSLQFNSLCAKVVKDSTFEPKYDTDYIGIYYELFNSRYELLKQPIKPLYVPAKFISMVEINPLVPVDLVYTTFMLLYRNRFNWDIIDDVGSGLYRTFGTNGIMTFLTTSESKCAFTFPIYFGNRNLNVGGE